MVSKSIVAATLSLRIFEASAKSSSLAWNQALWVPTLHLNISLFTYTSLFNGWSWKIVLKIVTECPCCGILARMVNCLKRRNVFWQLAYNIFSSDLCLGWWPVLLHFQESFLWLKSANDTQQQGNALTLLLWYSDINGLCWWGDLILIIAYWPQFSWVLQHFSGSEWKSVLSTIRVLTQSDWGTAWES